MHKLLNTPRARHTRTTDSGPKLAQSMVAGLTSAAAAHTAPPSVPDNIPQASRQTGPHLCLPGLPTSGSGVGGAEAPPLGEGSTQCGPSGALGSHEHRGGPVRSRPRGCAKRHGAHPARPLTVSGPSRPPSHPQSNQRGCGPPTHRRLAQLTTGLAWVLVCGGRHMPCSPHPLGRSILGAKPGLAVTALAVPVSHAGPCTERWYVSLRRVAALMRTTP